MPEATVIGRGTQIRGRVSGQVDLEILGHIDGEVAVDGDVTVDAEGLVGANVSGRRLVVRGAVKGDLTGEDAVVLEDGARVVGDVRAPRIAIAPGALVRGYVQTGDAGGPADRGARPAAARVAAPAPSRAVKSPAPVARPAPAAARTAAPAATPAPSRAAAMPSALSGAAPAAKHGPPPPVVPALKKGVKGAMKKKG
jgi:cytoskeletal protein CcmA (bactofilin family)